MRAPASSQRSRNQLPNPAAVNGLPCFVTKKVRCRSVGGIPFTRGPLAHLLRNRFYVGEVDFKGEILQGEHPAILDRDLFEAVQVTLSEQATNHTITRMRSQALLTGRIFDDRGNPMS